MARISLRYSRIFIAVLSLAVVIGLCLIIRHGSPQAAPAAPPAPAVPLARTDAPGHGLAGDVAARVITVGNPLPATRPTTPRPAADRPVPPDIRAMLAAGRQEGAARPSDHAGVSIKDLLADAKAKRDNGQMLQARAELNDVLASRKLSDAEAGDVKALMSQFNADLVFSRSRYSDDPYAETYVVKSGDVLGKVASGHDLTWQFVARINGVDPKKLHAGQKLKLTQGPFLAVVDKTRFTMDIYLGGFPGERSAMYVTTYGVGLGKDNCTPVGTWSVEPGHKLTNPDYYSPRGEGVIPAGDAKNPLGGFWIGLTGTDGQAVGQTSYGIHGTNDPGSIGKQSSMGCIRMHNEDAAIVYEMMVEGKSMVVVKE